MSLIKSEEFYSNIKALKNFTQVANFENYVELPNDWCVLVADIKGSTKAIQEGRYKAVNTLGVSVITGTLNQLGGLEIPYVFGGDGATLCIPETKKELIRKTLIACRSMAQKNYHLDLRVGMVPVSDISSSGYKVLVAKHEVSKNYEQAAFAGGGLEYADSCIKNQDLQNKYLIPENEIIGNADYTGLECRWKDIPSPYGETVSLLVKVLSDSIEKRDASYSNVLQKITEIYGSVDQCNPISVDNMELTLDGDKLSNETNVKSFNKGVIFRIYFWFSLRIKILIGAILIKLKIKSSGVSWGNYKNEVVANSDIRKFDDMLRQILSGTTENRKQLEVYLHDCFLKKELVYGIHVAKSALMTCMIGDYNGKHIHFIDGSDGGYALAAKNLKKQLASI